MKKIFLIICFFNLFLIQNIHSLESHVVLKVNNKIITNVDIINEHNYLLALNRDLQKVDKRQVRKLAKNSIIKEKIKEDELLKYFDLTIENRHIEEIIKNFYIRLGLNNKSEFEKYLSNYNLDLKDIKKKISIETAWNDLIYQKFSKSIKIDEKKIRKKIEKIILNNKEQNSYLLNEILFNADSSENINTKYKLIKKSIEEVGFKNTANIHSISDSSKLGGQIGWINENQISEKIKKELINLNINEYTKPITIPGGLLILYISDKKTLKKKLNFDDEFKKQISFEKNTQLDRFSKIYFKKIKNNSVISEN